VCVRIRGYHVVGPVAELHQRSASSVTTTTSQPLLPPWSRSLRSWQDSAMTTGGDDNGNDDDDYDDNDDDYNHDNDDGHEGDDAEGDKDEDEDKDGGCW